MDFKSRWDFDWIGEGPVGTITVRAEAAVWKVFARNRLYLHNSPCRGSGVESLPGTVSIYFVFALQVNFVLFIGIIVILVQKLQSPDMGGNESSIYL